LQVVQEVGDNKNATEVGKVAGSDGEAKKNKLEDLKEEDLTQFGDGGTVGRIKRKGESCSTCFCRFFVR
jgi:hypothetical protein